MADGIAPTSPRISKPNRAREPRLWGSQLRLLSTVEEGSFTLLERTDCTNDAEFGHKPVISTAYRKGANHGSLLAHHLTAVLHCTAVPPELNAISFAMTDPSQPSAPAPPFPHIRSCEWCRQRKVKCDRQQPCSHCARSGHDCLYPSGPGRAPKRSRRAENAELMDKLGRLEHIIKRLASENKGDAESTLAGHTGERADSVERKQPPLGPDRGRNEPLRGSPSELSEASGDKSSSLDAQFGRLVINDSMSYYVGNVLWANLANEVRSHGRLSPSLGLTSATG